MVGAQPQTSVRVALDGSHTIIGETILGGIVLLHLAVEAVDIETVVSTHPDLAVVLTGDSHGLAVVGTISAKDLNPTLALNIKTAETHGGGHVDTFAIGRDIHLRDVVVGDAVHLTIGLCTLLQRIAFDEIALRVYTHQTVFHCGEPQTALGITLHIHHDEILIFRIIHGMILLGKWIDPAEAVAIGTHPDMTVGIFFERHHRRGDSADIVLQEMVLFVETVETVLIGAYPHTTQTVDEGAHDTCATDDILVAHLVTHIVKTTESDRLAIDTLLQESKPEVATSILGNRTNLTLREVDLHTEERIVEQLVAGGFVDGHTLSVVADDDTTEVVAEERRHGVTVSTLDLYELGTLQTEHTRIGGSCIDDAIVVFTKTYELQVGTIGLIVSHLLTVVAKYALAISHEPQATLLVFNHRVDGMEIGQLTTHLTGVGLIRKLHHTQTRGSCQHIAIGALQETRGITTSLLALEVGHRHIIKGTTVPSLQGTIHTEIEQAVTVLHE